MLDRPQNALVDPYGRTIDYVRLSVTDRCDFRCRYCMPRDIKFLPKPDILTLEELERLGSTLIGLGIRKIRITGGEPLVRRDIIRLFRGLGERLGAGLEELTLTTNASQLPHFASDLYGAGVRRINISLDSLDADNFARIARPGNFGAVMAGIEAAREAGLKVKINMVALRGVNDHEIPDMVRWCGAKGLDLSLIEIMPIGAVDGQRSAWYLPLPKVKQALEKTFTLTPSNHATAGPSRYFDINETGGRIGFITPLSEKFCENCNRIRITCTGVLYMCLGQNDKVDLRQALRCDKTGAALKAAIRGAIEKKPEAHDFETAAAVGRPAVARHMNVTGG